MHRREKQKALRLIPTRGAALFGRRYPARVQYLGSWCVADLLYDKHTHTHVPHFLVFGLLRSCFAIFSHIMVSPIVLLLGGGFGASAWGGFLSAVADVPRNPIHARSSYDKSTKGTYQVSKS